MPSKVLPLILNKPIKRDTLKMDRGRRYIQGVHTEEKNKEIQGPFLLYSLSAPHPAPNPLTHGRMC